MLFLSFPEFLGKLTLSALQLLEFFTLKQRHGPVCTHRKGLRGTQRLYEPQGRSLQPWTSQGRENKPRHQQPLPLEPTAALREETTTKSRSTEPRAQHLGWASTSATPSWTILYKLPNGFLTAISLHVRDNYITLRSGVGIKRIKIPKVIRTRPGRYQVLVNLGDAGMSRFNSSKLVN